MRVRWLALSLGILLLVSSSQASASTTTYVLASDVLGGCADGNPPTPTDPCGPGVSGHVGEISFDVVNVSDGSVDRTPFSFMGDFGFVGSFQADPTTEFLRVSGTPDADGCEAASNIWFHSGGGGCGIRASGFAGTRFVCGVTSGFSANLTLPVFPVECDLPGFAASVNVTPSPIEIGDLVTMVLTLNDQFSSTGISGCAAKSWIISDRSGLFPTTLVSLTDSAPIGNCSDTQTEPFNLSTAGTTTFTYTGPATNRGTGRIISPYLVGSIAGGISAVGGFDPGDITVAGGLHVVIEVPPMVTAGNQFTATLKVKNLGSKTATVTPPAASDLLVFNGNDGNGASVVADANPSGPTDIAGGAEQAFVYQYSADNPATIDLGTNISWTSADGVTLTHQFICETDAPGPPNFAQCIVGGSSSEVAITIASSQELTFTVNSTGDDDDADTTDDHCDTDPNTAGDQCTLRAAIEQANATAGQQTIAFNLDGQPYIAPGSALPAITDAVTIDGTTQPGYDGTHPIVELDGTGAGNANGILVEAGGTTIEGLDIHGWGNGILLAQGDGNTVEGCFIGTDPTGLNVAQNAAFGVLVQTSDNTIGGSTTIPGDPPGNLISGNATGGVSIVGDGLDGNIVEGNSIGLDSTGLNTIPNGIAGVLVGGGDISNTSILNNVVTSNPTDIALAGSGVTGSTVQGNFVGTDLSGTLGAVGTLGILVQGAQGSLIGGTSPAQRNVVAGNQSAEIMIDANESTGNQVVGNYIGVGADGDTFTKQPSIGVAIMRGASNNFVGGTAAGAGNFIGGESAGVLVWASDSNQIQGNTIGELPSGNDAPNSTGVIIAQAAQNSIGGGVANGGNLITTNTGTGITLLQDGLPPLPSPPTPPDSITVRTTGMTDGTAIGGNTLSANGDFNNTSGVGGIEIFPGVTNTTIGGDPGSASVNKIVGNGGWGISIDGSTSAPSTGATIEGNLIGSDGPDGTPNTGGGIRITNANNNAILINTIVHNNNTGVWVISGTGNRIQGNSFSNNAGLSIDLGAEGPTPNDSGDGDTGANNLQNFPLLDGAASGSGTMIQGTLNSTPDTAFHIEFFSGPANGSASCEQTSGFGEATAFLGSTDVTTDDTGNVAFTAMVLPAPVGQFISATATDPNGNTSEFSRCFSAAAAAVDSPVPEQNATAQISNPTAPPDATATQIHAVKTQAIVTATETPAPPKGHLVLNGQLSFASTPGIDPLTTGVRVVVGGAGGTIIDATIPGGAFTRATKTGWKVNRGHTAWNFVSPTGVQGINAVTVKLVPKKPGRVAFHVVGRKHDYVVGVSDLPLFGEIALDGSPGGPGGVQTYPGLPGTPTCTIKKKGQIVCK